MSLGDKLLNERDHRPQFLRCMGSDRGWLDAKSAHVGEIISLIALGDDRRFNSLRLRSGNDLVVDVGNVPSINETGRPEFVPDEPGERVEHDGWTCIPDVRPTIDGRAAHIHRYPGRI